MTTVWRRAAAWAGAVGCLLGVGAGSAAAQTAPRMLVMPLENVRRDGRIFWLGEGTAVLLADDLNALGARAITREERRQAFDRLQVPPAATLTDATVMRIGQIVGASEVVVGTLLLDGEDLVVHVRGIGLDAGRITSDVTERGPVSDLFATIERVARRLAPSSSRSPADVRGANPPVAAFENYVKGLLAETPATATTYLNAALKADPTLDRARLALWQVYQDDGDWAHALGAVAGVPETSAFAHRARFLAGLTQMGMKDYAGAFATFRALADAEPTSAVLNNLGVVQLRRGGTAPVGQAVSYFSQASMADPADANYLFNLGYAYWTNRDPQAAIYWMREALRRNPADGEAHVVLAAALTAAGNQSEAARERELARRLSSVYQEWEKRPASDPVPKGLERVSLDVELPHAPAGLDAALANGQRDQQDLARFYVDRGHRLFDQDRDREALEELNRALFLSPYDAEAHLLVGRIQQRAGQTREAIDSLKISIWSAETAAAHAALAAAYLDDKDTASAESEARRALALDPTSEAARTVIGRLPDVR